MDQFHQYYSFVSQGTPIAVPHKWLAILNLVFAIGAHYSHLTQANWHTGGYNRLVYQSRAQILYMGESLISHPDLMLTQATSLLAFYLFSVGQANRQVWFLLFVCYCC